MTVMLLFSTRSNASFVTYTTKEALTNNIIAWKVNKYYLIILFGRFRLLCRGGGEILEGEVVVRAHNATHCVISNIEAAELVTRKYLSLKVSIIIFKV